jgi:hypothetical protein
MWIEEQLKMLSGKTRPRRTWRTWRRRHRAQH